MEGWSEARRIAQPFVTSAANREDVFARWYEQAQEAGISYRRTDMLEDWRREKGLVLHQAQLERMDPEGVPPRAWMTDKPWDGLTTSLVYEFRLEGWDVDKKEWVDQFVGVPTDTHVTEQEAIDAFFEGYIDAKVYGELVEVSMTFVSVWHKTGSDFV
jgi:hypothetical protein